MEVTTWENLERIFINIRFDIRNKDNYQVADTIIKVINNNVSNEEMCKMIFDINPKWKNKLIFGETEEKELNLDREIELFIIRAVELIKDTISTHEYEIAYDVADILQGLYGIIVTNQKKGLKQYWKIYVKPFQKKWNSNVFNVFKHTFV